MGATATQVDIYSAERAGLIERLCILAGQTCWREPVMSFGHGLRPDTVPRAHTLAAGLAYAHRRVPSEDEFHRIIWTRDPTDIGPYVLESLVYQRVVQGARIRVQLVAAMQDMSARLARVDTPVLHQAAVPVIRECATGHEASKPEGVPVNIWTVVSALGIRLLWASAGQTLRALAEGLR